MSDDDSSFGSSSSEEEGVYTVQSIVSKRGGRGGKKVEYLVRWKGYGSDDDTWEPADSLAESAAEAIAAFEKKPAKRKAAAATTKQPKPPSRSSRRESSAKRAATEPQPPAEPRPRVLTDPRRSTHTPPPRVWGCNQQLERRVVVGVDDVADVVYELPGTTPSLIASTP